MQKNILMALLLMMAAGMTMGYLQNRDINSRLLAMEQQTQLASRVAMRRPSVGFGEQGKQQDPYIAGPVKNTILKHYTNIADLYADYLKSGPQKSDGRIKVDWQISSDGAVISPEIIFSELDRGSRFEQRLLDSIASWHFPSPFNGQTAYVAHTFKLRRKAPTAEEEARARQAMVNNITQQVDVKEPGAKK